VPEVGAAAQGEGPRFEQPRRLAGVSGGRSAFWYPNRFQAPLESLPQTSKGRQSGQRSSVAKSKCLNRSVGTAVRSTLD
jgi:hypothetical protein